MNNNHELTLEQMQVCNRLRQMRLSGMAEALEEQLITSNSDLVGFEERFENIVNHEWELRFNKKFSRFLKKATLKYPQAGLDETIYEPDRLLDTAAIERLSTCHWIEEGRNLIITGATGAGKSYLANALCIGALRQFRFAKCIRANTLMNELERARLKSEYLDYVNRLAGLDLLIIDDFGLMEMDLDKCRNLFEVINSRESRKSTMFVFQLPVKAWYELFADSTYTDASPDRMIHKAYRLELSGRNMRNPNT